MSRAKTLISPKTGAETAAYDSGQEKEGCAVVIFAGPFTDDEQVEIALQLSSASGTAYAKLFHNGEQVVLNSTNPVQQLSIGPTYVVIKPVTAVACAVDVCPVGK